MTYVLGLSFGYHDAAAALLKSGSVVAASTEERHTRKKHDPSFPEKAIECCLRQAAITASDIDHVVYHEQPTLKFDRILVTALRRWRRGGKYILQDSAELWAGALKFDVKSVISRRLGIPETKIAFCEHHLSHASSAYFCSPFEDATIVTLDGVGEWETCTVSVGRGRSITKISSVRMPHSLGLFYSAITAFLGFEVNEGEYKVMGMAGFGHPTFANEMLSWFDLETTGGFRLRQNLFDFDADAAVPYLPALTDLLGPPRRPESSFDVSSDPSEAVASPRHYANVAASVQAVTETIVEHVVRRATESTKIPRVCLAGGVALNSAANQRLRRNLSLPMFVQPAAGDAGCSLGAAKHFYHQILGHSDREVMTGVALGEEFDDVKIRSALQSHYGNAWIELPDEITLCARISELLAAGKVIGWFQGRAEWGPRALGQRSILANPMLADMQQIVNEKIKFREPFRPFAPVIPADRASDYFDVVHIEEEDASSSPYSFMLAIAEVKPKYRGLLPAVTHVDNTARIQCLNPSTTPLFHRLVEQFGERTGHPILLNTSFNLRGEPIVNSPEDAIQTFEWSGIDVLVLGKFVIVKES